MALTLQETETHLNLTADDRQTWAVFSDDPVMQRRLERIGATVTKVEASGGIHYTMDARQVLLRKIPAQRKLTDAQRSELRERLAAARKSL